MNKNTRSIRGVAVLLAAAILLLALAGCGGGDKKGVNALLERFESSCRTLSISGICDCIDPAVMKPIKSLINILDLDELGQVGELSGLLDELVDALGLGGVLDLSSEDVLSGLTITPAKYEFSNKGASCKVTADVAYTIGGEDYSSSVDLHCIKVDDAWYLGSAD